MTVESSPILGVKITLKEAKYNDIDSTPMAFLEAGRDAGRKIHAALKDLLSNPA